MNESGKSKFFKQLWRCGRVGLVLIIAWSVLAWIAARGLIVNPDLTHADALVVLAGSSTYVERAHRAALHRCKNFAIRVAPEDKEGYRSGRCARTRHLSDR